MPPFFISGKNDKLSKFSRSEKEPLGNRSTAGQRTLTPSI